MADSDFETAQFTAQTLSEALPYIQRYDRQTIVIKFGGNAMVDPALYKSFASDVVLLKHLGMNPVVVHGGGPQIGEMLDRLDIKSEFKGGLRVTSEETVEVVEMVLAGKINKEIVRAINAVGGKAVGLSGSDAGMISARKAAKSEKDPDSNIERLIDLGYVGEPSRVDPSLLQALVDAAEDFIPVVAPVGVGDEGGRYNINADTVAGAIAVALGASRLLLLTDIVGVLDRAGELIVEASRSDIETLIRDGVVTGGMIPKLETAASAVEQGVGAAVIIDGRAPHAMLMELFTEHGAGTFIS